MKSTIPILLLLFSLIIACNTKKKPMQQNTINANWWKEAVVYQLYPRSFKDSNGDGIGDLNGVTEKISYLQKLGINAIWMNPICESPNDDNGYDISNYKGIMKEMGTMKDFDDMMVALKKANINLIMDLVLNHSSDEHEWFKQAKSSRTNKYRNYYHWWPAEKGTPPKRFSLFDEKSNAWKYDTTTNSYYLHYFSKKQPDLNWENPALRQEFYDIMKFWLKKGVAGFRLDAYPFMAKDTTWPAMPNDFTNGQFIKYYGSNNNLHKYLNEMHHEIFSEFPNCYLVGEGGVVEFKEIINFVHKDRKELNSSYHSDHVDSWGRSKNDNSIYDSTNKDLLALKNIFYKWDTLMKDDGWNTAYFTNHDHSRAVSRFGDDGMYRIESAKMLMTCLLTQRATPYIYNGDEIGMTNIRFNSINDYNDLSTKNWYKQLLATDKNKANQYLESQKELSRDNSRTPMQWNTSLNAGFTTGTPWLKINPNYLTVNVEDNINNKESIFTYTQKMIQLRNKFKDVLVYGKFNLVDENNKDVFAYTRNTNNQNILVLLNFSNRQVKYAVPQNIIISSILINNYSNKFESNILQPFQSVVLELSK
ncbi:MAG: glycoside hydrolase family 13 protein [Chitinophagaceae bacterium]